MCDSQRACNRVSDSGTWFDGGELPLHLDGGEHLGVKVSGLGYLVLFVHVR